jgi:hypothetical protein
VRLRFERVPHETNAIKRDFDSMLDALTKNISYSKSQIESYQAQLPRQLLGRIEKRKIKLLNDKSLAASLGFPIRPREGTAPTYSAPIQRRRIPIAKPKVSGEQFRPEPCMEDAVYEQILNTICNLALVMERSPSVFIHMDDETIRQHILVQLNGQYEGRATGETFNGAGKTDILIRENGKNIFIAECKFWTGAKAFTQTIDQLLSYTSWRDAKTAVVLFNRNKETTSVLKQIPRLAKAHPCFRTEIQTGPEARFRFAFNQPGDPNRQIHVAVLVFDVPRLHYHVP